MHGSGEYLFFLSYTVQITNMNMHTNTYFRRNLRGGFAIKKDEGDVMIKKDEGDGMINSMHRFRL